MYNVIILEEFKKQPKWKGPQFAKGIYALRIRIDEIKTAYAGKDPDYCHGHGVFAQFTTHLKRGTRPWIQAASIGNITFDDPYVTIIGQFEKNGSDIFFVPETEKYYDSPY